MRYILLTQRGKNTVSKQAVIIVGLLWMVVGIEAVLYEVLLLLLRLMQWGGMNIGTLSQYWDTPN